jgi:hypothetical protein
MQQHAIKGCHQRHNTCSALRWCSLEQQFRRRDKVLVHYAPMATPMVWCFGNYMSAPVWPMLARPEVRATATVLITLRPQRTRVVWCQAKQRALLSSSPSAGEAPDVWKLSLTHWQTLLQMGCHCVLDN